MPKTFKFGQVTLQSELSDRTGTNFIFISIIHRARRGMALCRTSKLAYPPVRQDRWYQKLRSSPANSVEIRMKTKQFYFKEMHMLSPFCLNVLIPWKWSLFTAVHSGILLGMGSANERRRYIVSLYPEWFLFAQSSWAGVSSRQHYDLIDAVTFVVMLWHSRHSFMIFTWKKNQSYTWLCYLLNEAKWCLYTKPSLV